MKHIDILIYSTYVIDRNHGGGSGASQPYSPPVQGGSQSQGRNNNPGGSKGKQRQEDTGSNDEGDDPLDPPPPQEPDPKWKIIHCADITLTILINNEDKGHSLRVITKAEVCHVLSMPGLCIMTPSSDHFHSHTLCQIQRTNQRITPVELWHQNLQLKAMFNLRREVASLFKLM